MSCIALIQERLEMLVSYVHYMYITNSSIPDDIDHGTKRKKKSQQCNAMQLIDYYN